MPEKDVAIKAFPIVGIGASAGGLEAFTTLLRYLEPNLGMAYVLIMHLSPTHKSSLTEVVRSKTKMQVHTVEDGMELKANHIFVIPPNTFMSVVDGHLKLAPRALSTIGNFAVDYFFTGLASLYKNNAIGVILSGTATDGTLGLKAIKAEGGITFAQDKTAEFSGMPQHAQDSGYVDFLLPPEGIAKELARLGKIPYTVLPSAKIEAEHGKKINLHSEELKKILAIVKNRSGIDFFLHYKQASIYRRVVRRMVLNKFDKLEDYSSMLKTRPKEVTELYNDFLINVTSFFRDQDFYKILATEVFPSFVKQEKTNEPIRIWVAGCSTGEEAYSIAISLFEFLEKKELTIPIQIFASDLDANAIEEARTGFYPLSALQRVSPDRLKRYFKKVESRYQIAKFVREVCVFSQHNLLKDPPFSRINLISCQNVLIYLETNPQKKVLQTFHYALKPAGYLFLGKSETIGYSTDLFEPLDKKIKLYTRKQTNSGQLEFTIHSPAHVSFKKDHADHHADLEKDIGKLMLSQYVYPSVVVNRSMKIVQFFGVTSSYLAPVTGRASFNILKMIREDLLIDLGSLLQQARLTEKAATKEAIKIYNNKIPLEITLEVVPKKTAGDIFYLIVFKEYITTMQPLSKGKGVKSKSRNDQKERTILRLQEELVQSRLLIKTTHEEYETTYEELQANNEEILSSNEELQSVNEELESSKEELQSANEELTTTNDELHKRNIELSESQNELKKVNEQLEQFAFISSHDLQEPLRKIETFAGLLSGPESNLSDHAKKYSAKIKNSANRMSALIKDLLKVSVLVKDYDKTLTSVNLNEILKNVIDDFEVVIEHKKANVNYSLLPTIQAQRVQMNQLFYNLIDNALKFSKENPVITISSREVTHEDFLTCPELMKDTHYVAISVKDNGIGFDQKYSTKMFVLFQRLHDLTDIVGTGVGLTICKKIVEDHNGFIFVNGKKNEGATFTIFIPAHAEGS